MTETGPDSAERAGSRPDEQVCNGCSQEETCRRVWAMPSQGPLTGAGLSLSSALVFLLPLGTAIVGGGLVRWHVGSGQGVLWQGAGVVGGLVMGAACAWLVMRVIKRRMSWKGEQSHLHQPGHS